MASFRRKLQLIAVIAIAILSTTGCNISNSSKTTRSKETFETPIAKITEESEFTECDKYGITTCSSPLSISNGLQGSVGYDCILHIVRENKNVYVVEYPENLTANINKDFVRILNSDPTQNYSENYWLVK